MTYYPLMQRVKIIQFGFGDESRVDKQRLGRVEFC